MTITPGGAEPQYPQMFFYITVRHHAMYWQPVSYTQIRFNIILENDSRYDFLLSSYRGSPLNACLGDSADIAVVADWLSKCMSKTTQHESCARHSKSAFFPRRLLNVRDDRVHLLVKTD